MRLLDLFCGAGGAAVGYHRAGFDEIVGVDIKPQKRYPFQFVQADALEFCASFGAGFDAIHASPPCQFYSISITHRYPEKRIEFQDLLPVTRETLHRVGRPWVIENVPGSPMRPDVVLCGSQFNLSIVRHRLFESNTNIFSLRPSCAHAALVISAYGDGTPSWLRRQRKALGLRPDQTIREMSDGMGIYWMVRAELCQAIPPMYTEFIGHQLLEALRP